MVINQEIEDLFEELLSEEKIQFFPSDGFFELFINLNGGRIIKINYEYIDELYNVKLCYKNGDEYCLSAYEFYKNYIKKNIRRRWFRKTTLLQHLVLLKRYLVENGEIMAQEKNFLEYISHFIARYKNIFL